MRVARSLFLERNRRKQYALKSALLAGSRHTNRRQSAITATVGQTRLPHNFAPRAARRLRFCRSSARRSPRLFDRATTPPSTSPSLATLSRTHTKLIFPSMTPNECAIAASVVLLAGADAHSRLFGVQSVKQ